MNPNVLLVVLDSVRARNLSLYGHPNRTTPFLESFSERATTYTEARAPSTWSLPSHVSMFTGLHVAEHGLTFRDERLVEGQTIWESLSDEHGYETGVFSSNPFLTAVSVGLTRAFDTAVGRIDLPFRDALDPREFVRENGNGEFAKYVRQALESDEPAGSLVNGLYEKVERDAPALLPDRFKPDTTGRMFVDSFLDWQADRSGPWAACLNLMDAHHPYEPEPEFDQWGGERLRRLQEDIDSYIWEFNGGQRPWWQRRALEGLYDGAIRQTDDILETLVTALEERGALEDTLVVITGDHGEGFGEPSNLRSDARAVGHGNGASHETLLHVPLIAKYPRQSDERVVDDLCSLTFFPTMVEAAMEGDEDRFHEQGPVVATASGLNERTRRNAEEYCDDVTPFQGETRILYEDVDGRTCKYASWKSRAATVEVRDAQTSYKVASTVPDRLDEVFADLSSRPVTEQGADVDVGVQQRLEDLGYA